MKKIILISAIILFEWTGNPLFAQCFDYIVVPLDNYLAGSGINNAGQVAGHDLLKDNAFIWQAGSYFNIPNTGSGGDSWGRAYDINLFGEVTGFKTPDGTTF